MLTIALKDGIEKIAQESRMSNINLCNIERLSYDDIKEYAQGYNITAKQHIQDEKEAGYLLAHEIGYTLLYGSRKEAKIFPYAYTEKELAASYFARAFLLPKEQFIDVVLSNTYYTICNYVKVADWFNVPESMVLARGRDLELWE